MTCCDCAAELARLKVELEALRNAHAALERAYEPYTHEFQQRAIAAQRQNPAYVLSGHLYSTHVPKLE